MTTSPDAGTKPPMAVEPQEWMEILAILQKCLPGRPVWAFGSRATRERLKRFSDLDLAVGGGPLPLELQARLTGAFDESHLPFKVDIVDLSSVTPEFRASIEPEFVLIQS